jgi:hypothetical protein
MHGEASMKRSAGPDPGQALRQIQSLLYCEESSHKVATQVRRLGDEPADDDDIRIGRRDRRWQTTKGVSDGTKPSTGVVTHEKQ